MINKKTPAGVQDGDAHSGEVSLNILPEGAAADADSAATTIRATRYLRMNVALGVLAVTALVAALYLARAFFVPRDRDTCKLHAESGSGMAEVVSRSARRGSGTGAGRAGRWRVMDRAH